MEESEEENGRRPGFLVFVLPFSLFLPFFHFTRFLAVKKGKVMAASYVLQ